MYAYVLQLEDFVLLRMYVFHKGVWYTLVSHEA